MSTIQFLPGGSLAGVEQLLRLFLLLGLWRPKWTGPLGERAWSRSHLSSKDVRSVRRSIIWSCQPSGCSEIMKYFKLFFGHVWLDWALFKVLGDNVLTKVAQMLSNFFWLFWRMVLFTENCCGNFWRIWATFYLNIWSHWLYHLMYPHLQSHGGKGRCGLVGITDF